jgi:predicted MFS family arabinose efflux permease
LLVFAAGAITGMQLIGRLVDRYGSAKIMIPAALAEGVALVLPALAPNLPALAVSLFVFGVIHGTLNIAMNANAVEAQRAWQRPIISSFHAIYSIGGFLGAAIGGLFARAGLSPTTTFLSVGAATLGLALWVARWTPPSPPATNPSPPDRPPPADQPSALDLPEPDLPGPDLRRPAGSGTSGVLFLGVLAFCCLVGEGAAADWSAVYLRDSLASTPGFAAAAYAAFSIMMTVGRLVGDRLAAVLGPVRLVRVSGALAAVGLAAALLVGRPIAGVIGFGCLGAGLSCIAPQVFSAAGNRDPARAGRALARVASLGYLGFLTGPAVIGGVATLVGLPAALTIPALLALFVALTATALRPEPAPLAERLGRPANDAGEPPGETAS